MSDQEGDWTVRRYRGRFRVRTARDAEGKERRGTREEMEELARRLNDDPESTAWYRAERAGR